MTLVEIEKDRYRNHLNKAIVGFIASFSVLSIALGTLLIQLFSQTSMQGEPTNNFSFNLAGVILAFIICASVLNALKNTMFFKEIYYVWRLKQLHNLIFRRLKKIKLSAKQSLETSSDINALIILNYYYLSLIQVYQLDDNTLTISNVEKEYQQLLETIAAQNLTISTEQFNKGLLKSY